MNSTFNKAAAAGSEDSVTSLIEQESPPKYVTFRSKLQEANPNSKLDSSLEAILNLMEGWFAKQDVKLSSQDVKLTKILNEQDNIKESMNFINSRFDTFTRKMEAVEAQLSSMETKVSLLEQKCQTIARLEDKIDLLDQQARSCNVEIANLPEKRGENILAVVENICNNIKFNIKPHDINSVHRVPHSDNKASRPKNIILKLRSTMLRDNFLAASRITKGITTETLGISGPPMRIYFNEHLTLRNKIIFREAREAAKKNGYRYVWPKHGAILVRANDSSPVFAVRSSEDVASKIKPQP